MLCQGLGEGRIGTKVEACLAPESEVPKSQDCGVRLPGV